MQLIDMEIICFYDCSILISISIESNLNSFGTFDWSSFIGTKLQISQEFQREICYGKRPDF